MSSRLSLMIIKKSLNASHSYQLTEASFSVMEDM